MRALPQEDQFVEFLRLLGNAERPTFQELGTDVTYSDSTRTGNTQNIIENVYGDVSETIQSSQILAPKNEDCQKYSVVCLEKKKQIS